MIIGVWANEGTTHDEEGAVGVLIGYNARERVQVFVFWRWRPLIQKRTKLKMGELKKGMLVLTLSHTTLDLSSTIDSSPITLPKQNKTKQHT